MNTLRRITVVALAVFALAAVSATAQTTYTWNQTGTASWATSTNWTPTRTTPAANDVLQFNNGATTVVTNVPVQTIGQLLVTGNTNVTLNAAAAGTLTIGGGTGTDLSVASGSQLNVSTATALTIALLTGTTGSISGSMTFTTGAHKLTSVDASSVTFQSGASFTAGAGFSSNPFGTTSLNSVVFANGSTYNFLAGANPFGATAPNSVVVFQTGSLYSHQASGTPSVSGRTYANFEMKFAGTITVTGTSAFVADNFTVTTGTFNYNMTGTPGHAIKGNISVASGQTLAFAPASAGTVNLNGTTAQSITNAGTLTLNSANQTIVVNNANGITLGSSVTMSAGTLTLTNGTISTGANTLTLNGTVTRTNGYVIGNLKKTYAATGSKLFEVGTANGYSPVTANVTAGAADLTVVATQSAQPNVTAATSLSRYWTLTPSAALTADLTFQYLAGDVNGTEANYNVISVTGGTPSYLGGTINTGAHTASITGQSSLAADWTAGEAPDVTPPTVTSVNVPTNGSYGAGANLDFTMNFSEPVIVGGTPRIPITLNTGGTVFANYVSGSNSAALLFRYTIVNGNNDPDGITLAASFDPNGGSVKDAANNNAVTTLNGVPSTTGILVDTTAPNVVSVTRVNATPTAATTVDYTVTFDEAVTGVDAADFTVNFTGITGPFVSNVTGTGSTRTVTVNTGSGTSGTLRLDVNNGASITDLAGNALAAGFNTGETYTIDKNAPAVVSVTRNNTNPTNAASVAYTVTFNQSVTGVDNSDFALTTTGVTGASVTNTTGSGTTYTVTVNTGSGDGTIRLDVNNDGSIQSGTAVPLSAPFTSGEVYTLDRTAPTVSSIVRADPNPTNHASVFFTVTFSEAVGGVAGSDFALTTTGVTGASVTGVSGSGSTRLVQVNSGSGDGTIRLDLVTGGAITDAAGNPLTTGFTTGEVYTIDKTAPTVSSSVRADANPTSAASVNFTVTFSEAMTSVINSDFALTTTGGITGASVSGVTGSGSTRTVTVNTGSGEGTIRLDVVTGATAQDLAGNLLASSFTGGQVYTVDKVAPSVSSINRAGSSPTGAPSVSWTVTFSEPVSGVDASDFALVPTGVSGASISGVTGGPAIYTVTANSGTGSGSLGLNLVDDDSILDVDGGRALGGPGAGNGNFTGQVYAIDHTVPTVVSINRAAADPTTASSVNWTVTFSESVTGVNNADFALAASGLTGSAITNVTGSGSSYTVTASTGNGNGTLGLNLADDDSIIDAAGNPLGGPGAGNGNFTGQVYTVNRAAASHLVISQVYGGGGNSGATFKNDFIELFNPTGSTVSVNGWSVQYSSAAGTAWQVTNLTGSIAPGHYYLVQEAAGAGGTTNLPTPDATGGINMSGASAKVALVNQTTALTGACPLGVTVIDFVGYGTASCFEGSAAAATLTNTTSASRIDNGCTDTDHNNTDFTAGTVNPRNSGSSPWSCGGLIGAGSASPSTVSASASVHLSVTVTPAQSPSSTGITVTGDLTPIGGSASQSFFDDGAHNDGAAGDNVFGFDAIVGAATSSGQKTLNVSLADAQARAGQSTITLTVLGATNPSGNGSANPASVAPTQSSLLTVAVTMGQNPPSTGITVTVDLTSIGGSASQAFFDNGTNGDAVPGDGTWSFNATVANATPLGLKSLPVTIQDAQARTGSTTISLTVQSATAPPAPTNLVAVGGNAQVSLSWGTSAGATGYNIKRGTASGGPYATVANNVGTNSFLDTLVANGTHYYYIVTAVNATDESGPSNEADAIPQAPPPSGSLAKIYFIDIGQGASTLIVSPTGKTLLVDGGPTGQGTQKVVPLLTSLGITRLDYTILTHYHIDHDDGLTETINAGKGALTAAYDNGDTTPLAPPNPGSTKTAYQNYVNALTSHTITRIRPEDVGGTLAGQDIDLGGGMHATIMAQGGRLLSGGSVTIDNSDLNTESISTLIQYGNFDFLVSGDLTGGGSTSTAKTPDVETYVAQMTGDVDIVEYDHHGSTTANNPRFLRLLKAEAAVAECGYTNTFGHPNRETVNKYLNIAASSGNTYGGTGLPNPGNGPVSYQTDPSPATDDRVSRQGYSGAAPANAGNGTILLKTDGTTSFTMESFDDAGVRLNPAQHAYSLDSAGAGVETNFPPTVIPSISPIVPTASDTVTVSAMVNDREDPITSVTLNYSLNGAAQAPVPMSLVSGFYTATIPAQPDATRVDITVTAVAGGKATPGSTGYFSGTTPIATLRVLDALGEPLYLDYAARVSGTATSDTNTFSIGTNDDYLQDATGGINVWRTTQPSVPGVDSIVSGHTYTVAGRIGELAGRFHIEVTPPFASVAPTPYTITDTGTNTVTPLVRTIAQINSNPESLEGQLVSIGNCTITSGTIPGSGASADAFLTVTDGSGSFQLKIDKDTSIPGMATPAGTFAIIGIIQQDDFLRPFDSGYDITPRSRVDIGGSAVTGPALITIAQAKVDVDGSGFSPGDYVPDLLNTTVHVQGVVTSINFRLSNGSGIEYYVQDPTGGVDIFSTATTRSFNVGDNLDVIATVKQFNGLTEIDPGATTSNLTVLAAGTLPPVSPRLVTCADIGDNGVGEPLEGQLLRINNVTLTSPPATWAGATNYTINDASGPCTIRISASTNLVGQAPPAGTFSIMGVLGQFDSTAPADSGYQLFPRSTSDMLPSVPATASIQATSGTPQSTVTNTAFASPMQATVRDAGNATISGAGVTFTAPASGASGTFPGGATSVTVISDNSGVAIAPVFTANSTPGSYSVTATSGPVNTTFSLTNINSSATHFSVTAPASVNSGASFNVTVTALDGSNATVTGYTGTVTFTSSATGTLPGDYTFTLGDAGVKTFSATLTGSGSQTVTATDTVTASITGTANVTLICNVPPTPTISADTNGTGTQDQACPEQPLTLHANGATGATSYQWYQDNNTLNGETAATYQATGVGTYYVTATNACGTTVQSAGYVVQNPTPHSPFISFRGQASTVTTLAICAGSSQIIDSDSATGIQWWKDGAPIAGANSQSYTATQAGVYTAQLNALGCHSQFGRDVTITVTPLPAAPTINAGGATTFCQGGSVTLTSSSASGNQWLLNGNPIGGATNQTYNATASGNYTATVTTNGCTSPASNTISVTVNPIPAQPTITPSGPTTFCQGGSVTLTSSSATGNQWSVNGSTIGGATNQTYIATTAGDYTVAVTTNGCTSPDSAVTTVSVNPNPNATITAASSVQSTSTGNIASVANAGAGATYNWSITNGTITGGTGTNSITYTAGAVGTLTLQVTVTTSLGCSDTKSANVNVTTAPPALTVTSVVPPAGKTTGGRSVTIHGTGFVTGATVTFGGSAATSVVVVNATTITAVTPAHAGGAVNVTVTNPSSASATLTNGYTYVPQQFDANGDNVIDPADIFYLVNYIFLHGPAPDGATGMLSGDANGDGVVDSADIFYLVNYLYLHGPAPAITGGRGATESIGRAFSGSIALGTPVRSGNRYVIPVSVEVPEGGELPQAMALRVVFSGGALDNVTIHRAAGLQPAFEISRNTPDSIAYLVAFDKPLRSGVVAQLEVAAPAGEVHVEIDKAVTLLTDGSGSRKATVEGGTLRVTGTTIGSSDDRRSHEQKEKE